MPVAIYGVVEVGFAHKLSDADTHGHDGWALLPVAFSPWLDRKHSTFSINGWPTSNSGSRPQGRGEGRVAPGGSSAGGRCPYRWSPDDWIHSLV